ncbi:MAG TPA: hypothetical protein VG963_24460 [Polyangiaceae bacterium]|nr:hypothetical protein [Polyangiaceae bacterium]
MPKLLAAAIALSLMVAVIDPVRADDQAAPTPTATPTTPATQSSRPPEGAHRNQASTAPDATPATHKTDPVKGQAANENKPDADPVVCKKLNVSGSRVRKQKVCMTQSQWANTKDNAQRMLNDVNRNSAAQPGGQTLQHD